MGELILQLFQTFLIIFPILMFFFKRQITEFFVIRNNNNDNVVTGRISEMPIKAIQNPFTVIFDHVKSTSKDGLYIQQIKSNLERLNCLVCWNVNINKFYAEFENDIETVLYKGEKKFLEEFSDVVDLRVIGNSEYADELYFEIPKKCQKKANAENEVKKVYPIVLVLYRENTLDITVNDILCSVWIIHLKDSQMKTQILHNYSKCLSNRILTMNQIFDSDAENLCVACQTEKSNLVLLPCSHNCVCSECFKRIGIKCPVCRQVIASHFEMKD